LNSHTSALREAYRGEGPHQTGRERRRTYRREGLTPRREEREFHITRYPREKEHITGRERRKPTSLADRRCPLSSHHTREKREVKSLPLDDEREVFTTEKDPIPREKFPIVTTRRERAKLPYVRNEDYPHVPTR